MPKRISTWLGRTWVGLAVLCLVATLSAGCASGLSATNSVLAAKAPAADPADHVIDFSRHDQPLDAAIFGRIVEYLASEELEGRGPGTHGLDLAREFLKLQFQAIGLAPAFLADGAGSDRARTSWLQPVTVPIPGHVEEASIRFESTAEGAPEPQPEADRHYRVLSDSPTAEVRGRLIFGGYGIVNEEDRYDSFRRHGKAIEDGTLEGQILVIFRYEPMNEQGRSRFTGGNWSSHAVIRRKAELAARFGAEALVIVDPPSRRGQRDGWLRSTGRSVAPLPVIHLQRDRFEAILGERGAAMLEQWQKAADDGELELTDIDHLMLDLRVRTRGGTHDTHNVAGILPGAGELADEWIVIGGHYDHLGYGHFGSRRPGSNRIHPGADDNASGTAGVVQLAAHFTRLAARDDAPASRRTLMFVGFTGEELGLIGSFRMVQRLEQELGLNREQIVCMFNFDMIGRVRDRRLLLLAGDSSPDWSAIIQRASAGSPLEVRPSGRGLGGSDHMPFLRAGIPALFFHTGLTPEYHTPDDTADTLNNAGAAQVLEFAAKLIEPIWNGRDSVRPAPNLGRGAAAGGVRGDGRGVRLGIMPDYAAEGAGVAIGSVSEGTPAHRAGLRAGDRVTHIGDDEVSDLGALVAILANIEPGTRTTITINRADEVIQLDIAF
ncbi:MAG: M28 family peptidase [Phycisphaeraceae bacterium]|nr:M28 family peptidase [Phycisphaeraceae bacterium]